MAGRGMRDAGGRMLGRATLVVLHSRKDGVSISRSNGVPKAQPNRSNGNARISRNPVRADCSQCKTPKGWRYISPGWSNVSTTNVAQPWEPVWSKSITPTGNAVKHFCSRIRENSVVSGIARSLTTSATTCTHAFSRVKKSLTAFGSGVVIFSMLAFLFCCADKIGLAELNCD